MKYLLHKNIAPLLLSLIIVFPYAGNAGSIADFELDATKSVASSVSSSSGTSSGYHHSHGVDSIFGDILYEILFYALFYGGAQSSRRMIPSETTVNIIDIRKTGDPLLPIIRIDTAYQWLVGDVYAVDSRIEGGWGPIAFQIRNTEYKESRPEDELDVLKVEFLYRISESRYFEMDLGIGSIKLKGQNSHSGTSFSMPILIYPTSHFGIEIRPSWADINGNSISDYDVCVLIYNSYLSFRGGYRTFRSENESLNGPYAGVSIYF